MANATIFTKTLTGGNNKGVILEPGMELLRETNLPLNWLKVRLGFIGSYTNLTQENGTPNNETVVGVLANRKTSFNFGLSNGVGYFGDVGNRFVGHATSRSVSNSLRMLFSTTYWDITGGSTININVGPTVGDGSAVTSTNSAISYFCRTTDPVASSASLFSCCIDMDLTASAGNLRMTQSLSTDSGLLTPLSSASDITMNQRLMGSVYSAQQDAGGGGGWWNQSGSLPIGCRFFSIRNPFQQNRIRILNMMVQQLA